VLANRGGTQRKKEEKKRKKKNKKKKKMNIAVPSLSVIHFSAILRKKLKPPASHQNTSKEYISHMVFQKKIKNEPNNNRRKSLRPQTIWNDKKKKKNKPIEKTIKKNTFHKTIPTKPVCPSREKSSNHKEMHANLTENRTVQSWYANITKKEKKKKKKKNTTKKTKNKKQKTKKTIKKHHNQGPTPTPNEATQPPSKRRGRIGIPPPQQKGVTVKKKSQTLSSYPNRKTKQKYKRTTKCKNHLHLSIFQGQNEQKNETLAYHTIGRNCDLRRNKSPKTLKSQNIFTKKESFCIHFHPW